MLQAGDQETAMPAVFAKHGLQFAYPENWTLDERDLEDGWSVAVQSPSPGTAFLLLSVHPDRPAVQEVLDATLRALREDYAELDASPAEEEIAGRCARGLNIQFISLDLVNNCWIRSFRTKQETVLIEADLAEPVMRAMRASIQLEPQSPAGG
jgi:hypothetical protein